MAKLLFSKKAIESILELNEKGIEKLALFGTPMEHMTESEIECEISANRPDLLSEQGILRSLKAFLGKSVPEYKTKKVLPSHKVIIEKSVKSVRPFTRCAIIKDIELNDESIKQLILLQEKLHASLGRGRKKAAIGVYPLDKITFPIKFSAKSPKDITFTPIGSDRPMNAIQILEKNPIGKEYAHLLEKESKYPVFIDSKGLILSMPPIVNSEETGRVDTTTKNLFVECSGSDKHTLDKILAILVTALADMGGTIAEVTIEDEKKEVTPDLTWEKWKFDPEYYTKITGIELKEKELTTCLKKMGHEYKGGAVYVAPWRTDILHQIDLVEDIIIAYGYDKLIPIVPAISTIAEEDPLERFKAQLMEVIVGLGGNQIMTPHFITTEEAKTLKESQVLHVESSKSEFTALRPNLLIPLLRTLARNTDTEYPQKLFECGKVFTRNDSEETGVSEEEQLIIGITPGNATEAKQIADYIARMLNHTITVKETKEEGFIEGRTATLLLNNTHIGTIGEIHPNTLREWRLKMPLAIVTFNVDALFKQIYPK